MAENEMRERDRDRKRPNNPQNTNKIRNTVPIRKSNSANLKSDSNQIEEEKNRQHNNEIDTCEHNRISM